MGDFHLAIVFFDILQIDDEMLLHQNYTRRRNTLLSLIQPISGFASVAENTLIDFGPGMHSVSKEGQARYEGGLRQLHRAFSICHAHRGEGLVLKAVNSSYVGGSLAHGIRHGYVEPQLLEGPAEARLTAPNSWVKLKADYIPGLGDGLDLCIIGASWNVKRARELRVPTGALIEFHLGAIRRREAGMKHAVHSWFSARYGLTRQDLVRFNVWAQNGTVATIPYKSWESDRNQLDYSLRVELKGTKPDVIFKTPILAEVMGGGFQKDHGTRRYHLRWPRITKVYSPNSTDRSWEDGDDITFCMRVAKHSVRRIEESALWKEEYLNRIHKLTLIDQLEWEPHEVKHDKMHITAEECVEPPVKETRRLPMSARRSILMKMAVRAGQGRPMSHARIMTLSRSEPNLFNDAAGGFKLLAWPGLISAPSVRIQGAAPSRGRVPESLGNITRTKSFEDPSIIMTRTLQRSKDKKISITEERVAKDSLRGALLKEGHSRDLKVTARGGKFIAKLRERQEDTSGTVSKGSSIGKIPSEDGACSDLFVGQKRKGRDDAEADAQDESIAKRRRSEEIMATPPHNGGPVDEVLPAVTDGAPPTPPRTSPAAHVAQKSLRPSPTHNPHLASTQASAKHVSKYKCGVSPRLCETFFHLFGPHLHNGDPNEAQTATDLYKRGIPETRSSIAIEMLLFAIGGRMGLGLSHSWGVPGGRKHPPPLAYTARPKALTHKSIHPFHARGIIFVDEDRLDELGDAFWASVSYPPEALQSERRPCKELCSGAALHPRRHPSPILLLSWTELPYAVWLMEQCEMECGRWKEVKDQSEWEEQQAIQAKRIAEKGPGCECCRHFDPLIDRSLSPQLPPATHNKHKNTSIRK